LVAGPPFPSKATTSELELLDIKEDLLVQFNFVNHMDGFTLHLT